MANEEREPDNIVSESFLIVDGANNEGTSLESTSASESAPTSVVTQIESVSSPVQVVETSNQINFQDAKEAKSQEVVENQSSSSKDLPTPGPNCGESGVASHKDANLEFGSGGGESSSMYTSIPEKEDFEEDEGRRGGDEEEDQSYDEDTLSSEAVVDDIELILMPETVQDFAALDLSPQLVRVTELKRFGDYDADVFEDDETDQESDFRKYGTDDEEGNSERSVSTSSKMRRHVFLSSNTSLGGGDGGGAEDNENEEPSSCREYLERRRVGGKKSSGVQTEISALETTCSPFELKRRSSGKSKIPFGIKGKRLNWKSELTLLPSKTKIRPTGFSGYESTNYQDQYSLRGAKFTSQDTLNSSSQFLKPSALYRTRNLSRNLNQCESSESTLILPAAGLPSTSTSDFARYHQQRDRISSSTTSTNFKESYSSYKAGTSAPRRQPLASGPQGVSFRSSLPDLSSSPRGSTSDNKGHRTSFKSMRSQKSSTSGYRLAKKSSSDDETSSLIDESERCLRSSIDLLLTDDLPSPGADLSCRSAGFKMGTSSHGYYSSRRSNSQPIIFDDGDCGDLRDATMGSPFLPRKLSDMRCSRYAKVILPNGSVSIVKLVEMDELRDTITVHTDTGCILYLPFRKVVFAWRNKR